jgi:cytoskeleton protein RodZ
MLGIPLDAEALPSPFTTSQIPSLVSHSYIPRYRYVAENLARRAVYVVLTVALVVPIWLATRTHLDGASPSVSPLDPPVDPMSGAAALDGRTTVVASMAPMPAPASRVRAALLLEATGETWFQALAADGSARESGMLRTGDRRELDPSVVARVVLGNSGAAQLSRAGRRVDLSPYTRANVARFTLSSDGSPAPIAP